MRSFNLFSLITLCTLTIFVNAQELTSDLSGTVLDSSGSPVSGANVVVTFEPTNTKTTRTTNSSGRFTINGMRPGGPYSVDASSPSGAASLSNISLTVGDSSRVTLVLESLEEVVTVAQRTDGFGQDVGLSTVITADDVEKFSSVTRDLKDFIRLNPMVVLNDGQDEQNAAFSIAGSGNRTNDIKVDGASYNDDFGLNANGYPGQNNPITLDSIDQINVRIAPVSVEYNNFEGGVIEVVSKGGTNEFKGSVYSFDRGDSYIGDEVDGRKIDQTFDDTSEGFAFGGPLIKDKAFFFVAYEENDKTTPIEWGPDGSGAPFSQNITLAQVEQIRADTISTYGFDPLLYTSSNTSVNENTTVRLDFYLSDIHRLQVNYRETDSEALRGSNRRATSYYFPSNEYLKPEQTESEGILFVSNWTDTFTTEVLFNSKETITGQNSPIGSNVANFNIENAFGMNDIYLGVDPFRSANALATTAETLKLKGVYIKDDHTLTFGYEEKTWDVYNVFIAFQDGSYSFDSYQDFLDKNASSYSASNSRVGTELGGAASFDYSFEAFFIQDEITLSDNLTATIGLRHDEIDGSPPPKASAFKDAYGFENYGFDQGYDITTWRLGLDYQFDDGSALKVLHGTYSTRFPLVWMSNVYSNNGVQTASFPRGGTATCDPTSNPALVTATQPQCVKDTIAAADFRDSVIVTAAPSFEWPKNKVTNITYEKMVNDWFVQFSYLKKVYDQPIYKALNTGDPLNNGYPAVPTLKAPDGRPIYNMTTYGAFKSGLYTQGGSGADIFTLSGSKSFNDDNSSVTIGYTTQNVNDINTAPSTTPNSSYGRNPQQDPNNAVPGPSPYETEHRLFATLKSTHYFFGADKPTTFALFAERRSGYPISVTFETQTKNPANYQREGFGLDDSLQDDDANFLTYVPAGINDPLVCWVSCTTPDGQFAQEAMQAVRDLGLNPYRGGIAPKGTVNSPWVTSLDLKITQILPGFRKNDEFVITLGIQNLLNLLDDEMGVYKYPYYTRTTNIFDVQMTEDFSKYILSPARYYDNRSKDDLRNVNTSNNASLWRAQLGFRYNFNF